MLQFVPMTDDVLYRTQDLPGPLVPYRCGLPCWHQLGEREEPDTALLATAVEQPLNA